MSFKIINLDNAKPLRIAGVMLDWREHRDVLQDVMGLTAREADFVENASSGEEIVEHLGAAGLKNRGIPGEYVRMLFNWSDAPDFYKDVVTAPPANNFYSVMNSYGISSVFGRMILAAGDSMMAKAIYDNKMFSKVFNDFVAKKGYDNYRKYVAGGWWGTTAFYNTWLKSVWNNGSCEWEEGDVKSSSSVAYPRIFDDVVGAGGRPPVPSQVSNEGNFILPGAFNGSSSWWPWLEIYEIASRVIGYTEMDPTWDQPFWTTGPFRKNWTEGTSRDPNAPMLLEVTDDITQYEFVELAFEHAYAFGEFAWEGMPCDWQDWPYWTSEDSATIEATTANNVAAATEFLPTTIQSATPPQNATDGDLWFDIMTGQTKVFVRTRDGGGHWVSR